MVGGGGGMDKDLVWKVGNGQKKLGVAFFVVIQNVDKALSFGMECSLINLERFS